MAQQDQGPEPKLQFKHVVDVPGGNQVIVEVFDNGAIATTSLTVKAGLWGGGGGGGGTRTCSGSCGTRKLGPISCPTGSSPVLDCINFTLRCRPNSGSGSGGVIIQ
jgi:hypothetical protein